MNRTAADTRRWLRGHVLGEWRRLSAGSMAMALRAGVLLLLPWPLKFIIDSVILGKPLGPWAAAVLPSPAAHRLALLHVLGIAILVLGLLEAGLGYLGNRVLLDAAQRIGFAVRRDFFSHLIRLPLAFHRRQLSGELTSRIGGDINALQQFVGAVGIDLVPQLLTICGILAVMLAMNWRYGLLTLAVAPVLTWIATHFATRIRIAARLTRRREGEQSGSTQEVLGNVQLVQACAREDYEKQRFTERAAAVLRAALRGNRAQAGFAPSMNLAIAGATGCIAWYGAILVLQGALTAGDLLVFLAYLRAIAAPARQLAKAGRVFGRAAVAIERIDEYRRETSSIRDSNAGTAPSRCYGHLEFRNVSFSYGSGRPVVTNVSFVLRPGATVALVGSTGAGKSTIAGLATRFHDPDCGSILLDGRDLREISLRFLRTRIALVPQEPLLFRGPIWANIAYGRDGATRDDAIDAARASGIADVIAALPDGFDMVVGERGATLSGGQRQCVAVARALLSDAAVVIFDEPSSSVDPLTERRLSLALHALGQRRAVLVIAHRLSTVVGADTILVLEHGRILERGSHEDLLASAGAYADLWLAHGANNAPSRVRLAFPS